MANKQCAAIIVAGGVGTRMNTPIKKQLMMLCGKPVLTHTLLAFERHSEIDGIILVVPGGATGEISSAAVAPYCFGKIWATVEGGANRQGSVLAGLKALETLPFLQMVDWVLVHDGVRPLVTSKAISDVIACVRQGGCAISGVRTKDTIKVTDENNLVRETSPRECTWVVQTPQAFPYRLLIKAHEQALRDGFTGTDDSVLAERLNAQVQMVEGDYSNIKLTTPEDMLIAEALMKIALNIPKSQS